MEDMSTPSAPVVAEVTAPVVQPQQAPAPAPESNSGFLGEITRSPMDWRSIVIASLLMAVSIYGIVYYRKALQNLEDGTPTLDDIDKLNADVAELKWNLKKALGAKYKVMPA